MILRSIGFAEKRMRVKRVTFSLKIRYPFRFRGSLGINSEIFANFTLKYIIRMMDLLNNFKVEPKINILSKLKIVSVTEISILYLYIYILVTTDTHEEFKSNGNITSRLY